MSALVYAAPYVPPAPPVSVPRWRGYRLRWHGADGSTWDLNGSQGVLLLEEGIVGLHLPAYDRYSSTSPATAGSRHRGSRARERSVEWNVLVYSDASSIAWRELDRAFWDSFDTDDPGVWEVIDPSGRALRLECILTPTEEVALARDPSRNGWALYQIRMIAPRPFWTGNAVSRSWANGTPTPFFDAGGSPDFHISNGALLSTAELKNPGDAQTWVEWTLAGPLTDISITLDGGTIELPDVADGSTLVAVTDPEFASVKTDGVSVFPSVTAWDPRPLPKRGAAVPLTIAATGAGTVTASFVPRYRRGL